MDSGWQVGRRASQPVELPRGCAVTVVILECVGIAVAVQQVCRGTVAVCQEEILDKWSRLRFFT